MDPKLVLDQIKEFFSNFTSIKARLAGFIACLIYYSLPKTSDLRIAASTGEGFILLLGLLSVSTLIAEGIVTGCRFLTNRRKSKRELGELINYAKSLTPNQKKILKRFLDNNERSLVIPRDETVKELEIRKFIYRTSTMSEPGPAYEAFRFSYSIQPWAWNYLNENKNLVE